MPDEGDNHLLQAKLIELNGVEIYKDGSYQWSMMTFQNRIE